MFKNFTVLFNDRKINAFFLLSYFFQIFFFFYFFCKKLANYFISVYLAALFNLKYFSHVGIRFAFLAVGSCAFRCRIFTQLLGLNSPGGTSWRLPPLFFNLLILQNNGSENNY